MIMKWSWCILFFLICNICTSSFAQHKEIKKYYQTIKKKSEKDRVTIPFFKSDTLNLYQIILVRHGNPDLKKGGWRKRKEAMNYVIAYDTVGVIRPDYKVVSLRENEIKQVYTSSLQRAVSTTKYLFPNYSYTPDSSYREFERKVFSFPNMSLPMSVWLGGSRIFWILGFNDKGIENFRDAKRRAKNGASTLQNMAKDDNKVLLVAHGFLNRYLSKYLKKLGWKEVYDGGKGYLSQRVLVLIE